jgi:hypothetical protein
MTFENNAHAYKFWLIRNRGLTIESAGSYVSYSRRVERDLALSLDGWVRTTTGLQTVIERIENEIPSKQSQGKLQTATRAYAEFLNRGA